uniref:Ankyrin repeat domain-containing protein 39 n=1 Tax=Cacopsylla melanoneura TaxID=428564 RepID=A0A8D8RFM0_9HEMI
MSMTEGVYVCVKGSLYGSDCATFGLTDKEVAALQSRFPNSSNTIQVVNGSYMKANPLQVINALSELGYEVVASAGSEAETTWTMRREVPVTVTMETHSHDTHDGGCCQGQPTSAVQQTLSELDFERGIWSAALFNEIERVTKLLDQGIDPNIPDNAGYTALHYAARSNNKAICMLLISRGANVNAVTRAGLATPLHRAASAGNEEIVMLLLDNGADPSLKDADSLNALDRSKKDGHENISQLLLERFPALENK